MSSSIDPAQVWELLRRGQAEVIDLRTHQERRRHGAPPGSVKGGLLAHWLRPRQEAIYLCQHAVRSKIPARRGAREVAGGAHEWRQRGLPLVDPEDAAGDGGAGGHATDAG